MEEKKMYGRMQSFPKFFYNKQVKVFGDGGAPGLMQLGPVGQRGVRPSPGVCQQRAKGKGSLNSEKVHLPRPGKPVCITRAERVLVRGCRGPKEAVSCQGRKCRQRWT